MEHAQEFSYRQIRQAFLEKGDSLYKFARRHGYSLPWCMAVAKGRHNGAQSISLRLKMLDEAGLSNNVNSSHTQPAVAGDDVKSSNCIQVAT